MMLKREDERGDKDKHRALHLEVWLESDADCPLAHVQRPLLERKVWRRLGLNISSQPFPLIRPIPLPP